MNAKIFFKPLENVRYSSTKIENLSQIISINSSDTRIYNADNLDNFRINITYSYIFKGNSSLFINGSELHRIEISN